MKKVELNRLGDFVKIKTGKLDANASSIDGAYPFFTCSETPLRISSYSYDCECILVAGNGDLNVKYHKGKFDAYQRTYIIESIEKKRLDVRFLYYFMSSYMDKLRALSIGGVIKYIKLNYLTDAQIFLPPLAEQIHIAQILDQADHLRQQDQQLLAHYDQLVQAAFVQLFGDPVRNEKGWEVKKSGEVISDIVGGTSYGGEERDLEPDELGVLKVSAVTKGYFKADEFKAVSKSVINKKTITPRKGDLLFSRANTRELVAATCIVDKDYDDLFLPDKLWRIDLDAELCNASYFKYLLSKPKFRNELTKTATGTSGSMLNVSMTKLRGLKLPIPPIDLQNRFAEIVTHIEAQKALVQQQQQQSEALFQSLLQRAFRGELGSRE